MANATVERLCGLADLPKPRLAVVRSDVPNAFATGSTPARSTVVVTRGLVRDLEPLEVQAVLAHELSHIANRDGAIMTFASFPALTLREGLACARLRVSRAPRPGRAVRLGIRPVVSGRCAWAPRPDDRGAQQSYLPTVNDFIRSALELLPAKTSI
jgi:hypothetical protein